MGIPTIRETDYKKTLVLTGAGISVASGLPTYRGAGGLWTSGAADPRLATATALRENPKQVWDHFAPLRDGLLSVQPNPGHFALADFEERYHGNFTLVTQNIDGLHSAAGSQNVVEFHGNIRKSRCSNHACDLPAYDDDTPLNELGDCRRCTQPLRADIVLFEEMIPSAAERGATAGLRGCDLFIAIGTSGTVTPAASLAKAARNEGARTIYVNLEPLEFDNGDFVDTYLGRAEEVLPTLLGVEPRQAH